jgi:MFS family permease
VTGVVAETGTAQAAGIDVPAVQRRSLGTLSTAAVLGGIATAGAVPAGALLGASFGGEGVAGLAQTMGVLGAAVLALPLARIALTRGRRAALSVGYSVGAVGAVVVVVAGVTRSLTLVLLGCLLVGVASASGYQARYAATDLAEPSHRARALSFVVWAGTIGAVLGPNLLGLAGNMAVSLGLPQLTGPYLQAVVMLVVAVFVLLVFLRPDPYLLARSVAQDANAGVAVDRPRLRDGIEHLRRHRRAMLGVISVALGHVVMVMVMVMTPVHMAHVDVSLQLIGLVVSVHVLGMYALAPVVGWLVDRLGRVPMILVGAAVLAVSAVVCGLAPADSVPILAVGLFLLGLGWSCTLIAGSTLLTDDVGENERPAVQGLSDLVMNLSAALGGALAGVIVVASSYGVLCAVALLPVLAIPLTALRLARTPDRGVGSA